jgi:hypothetical protein
VNSNSNCNLPAPVSAVRRRLEQWRKSRPKLGPMPAALWQEAAQLAQHHGVNPIAQALGLEYYALKRHMVEVRDAEGANRPAFVEVSVPPPVTMPDCVVEMERPDGARMRIRLPDQRNLIALTDSFWRCQA